MIEKRSITTPARLGARLLATSALLPVMAAGAVPAYAQDTTDAPSEIVVTGSRLIRTDLTAPSPTTVIGEEDIALSGNVTLEKTVNEFPQLAGGNTSTVNNGGGSGVLTANLRALGATRTLTLVNGRRFIPADSSGNADLASIPDILIKRVDIITGGASAVYGSDAIAGAVNFVLDDSFEGIKANAQYGITDRGDASSKKLDLAIGTNTGDGRGNVTFTLSYTKQDPAYYSDREYSATPLGESSSGELVYSGSGSIPGTRVPLSAGQRDALKGIDLTPAGACTTITGIRFGEGGAVLPYCQPEDTYNYAPYNLLQRPLDRINLSANAHYDITDSITAYAEGYFVNTRNDMVIAPDSFTPLTPGAASSTLLVPEYAINPVLTDAQRQFFANNAAIFDPDGDGTAQIVGAGRRADELGTRNYRYERLSYQLTTGLRGNISLLGSDWNWDAFYQYMRNRTDSRSENMISQTRLSMGLDAIVDSSGNVVCRNQNLGCVPLSIFGYDSISPEAGAFITPVRENHDIFVRQVAGASISGALFDLPAGPVATAFGVEYRKDKYDFYPSPLDLANEYGAVSQAPLSGSYDVKEAFGEIRIPILSGLSFADTLAIEGAARFADYSSIGSVFAWKAGGEYAPVDWFRIRGAYNSAIRAPNISELYSAISRGYSAGTDLCDASTNPSDAVKQLCIAQGVSAAEINSEDGFTQATLGLTVESGGNPNLTEEKSKTYTIGAVISPPFIKNLNITVDYFNISIDDAIMTVNAQQTMNDCFSGLDINSTTCQSIVRLGNGQIDYVRTSSSNIGSYKVDGLDVQIDYSLGLPSFLEIGGDTAGLKLQGFASWLFKKSTQVLPTSSAQDCSGYYGAGCSSGPAGFITPDFKLNLSATYASGPVNWRVQGRMIDGLDLYPTATNVVKSVGSVWYFDTNLSFDINKTMKFYVGVDNLFDKQPPIFGSALVGDANTDVSLYDTLGRRYFTGISLKF